FEEALPLPEGARVVRAPSALAITGLRLRAWEHEVPAHPEATRLLPPAYRPVVRDPEAPPSLAVPGGPTARTAARLTLAAGHTLVRVEPPDGPSYLFGAPLTVPVLPEPPEAPPAAAAPAAGPAAPAGGRPEPPATGEGGVPRPTDEGPETEPGTGAAAAPEAPGAHTSIDKRHPGE
ncbi:MAG: hypothetical protein D6729_14365, partial [Deltaproteobacteria bacterium]